MAIENIPADEGREELVGEWKSTLDLDTLGRIGEIMEALGQTPDFRNPRVLLEQADALLASNEAWGTAPNEVGVAEVTDEVVKNNLPELASAAHGVDEVRSLLAKCLDDCRN